MAKINAFYGKKMTSLRIFNEQGVSVPVTEVSMPKATIVQIKTKAHDGYDALQLGFDYFTSKKTSKPLLGHLKKTGQGSTHQPRFLREIILQEVPSELPKIGDTVTVDQVFAVGEIVAVTGISKGKGFQGGVKRHGFSGGPRTHGQSDRERAPGSIGQTTTPGRVYKGKRMAGHMGSEQVTIKGLQVVGIDVEKHILQVKGLIPGVRNRIVRISRQ